MATWVSKTRFEGDPENLVAGLTDIEAIERWAPVPFRLDSDARRLRSGDQLGVRGALLGRAVHFTVEVVQADHNGLRLRAHGPFEIDVDYQIAHASSTLSARVETRAGGPKSKLLASAANALLAAGALEHSLRRVTRQAAAQQTAALAC